MSYASSNTNTNSSTNSYTAQEALDRVYGLSFQAELSEYAHPLPYTYGNTPLSSGSMATYAEDVSFNSAQSSPPSSPWQQEDLPSFQDFSYSDNGNNFSSSSSSSSSSLPSFNPQPSAFSFTPFNEKPNIYTQSSVDSAIQTGYEYEDWGISLAEINAEFGLSIWEMAAKMGIYLAPEGQISQGMAMADEMEEEKKKDAESMQVENDLDLQQAKLSSAAATGENASTRRISFEVPPDSLDHAPSPGEASSMTAQAQGSVSPALDITSTPTRQKKYKCQRMPFCIKDYSAPNGLKYHLEHGTCTSEPKKPRPPLKTKTQAKPKNIPKTESKAKEAGKVNEKRKVKGKRKGKAIDTDESTSSSGSSSSSSSSSVRASLPSSSSSSRSPPASLPHYRDLLPMPPGHLPPDVASQATSTTNPPCAPPLTRISSPLQSLTAYHIDSSSTPPFVPEGNVAHFDWEHNSRLQESTPRSSLLFRSALNTVPTYGTTSAVDQARDTVLSLSSSSRPSPPSAQLSFARQQSISWPMHENSPSLLSPLLLPLPHPQASTRRVPRSASTSDTPIHQYRPMNPILNALPQQTPNAQMQAQNISQNTLQTTQLVVDVARRTETSARPEMVPASTSAQEQQGRPRRGRPPTQIARPSAMLPTLVEPYTFSVPLSRPAPSNTSYISRSLASNTTILPPVAVPDPEAFAGLMEETERLKAIEARGTHEREKLENHYTKLIENYGRFRH